MLTIAANTTLLPISEGLAAVEVDYQMGFIDKNNNFVIEAKYTNLTFL